MATKDKDKNTVSMTALKYHTFEGAEYDEGDTYDVAADAVENLVAIGFAHRTDDAAAAAKAKASKPVEPMTTDNTPLAPTKPKK